MEIDHHSHLPLHAQAEAWLRELITAPEYRAGACIPDEIGLAKRLGVSRNTMRTALERLVHAGLLERRRGVGTRVVQAPVASQRTRWDAFLEEIEPQRQVAIDVLSVRSQGAPEDAATALGIAPGAAVLHLSRLLRRSGEMLASVQSWLHPRLGLNGSEDFQRPLYELIERGCGVIPTLCQEDLSAQLADLALSRLLALKRPAVVLVRRRVVSDAQRRPLEVALAYYPGEQAHRSLEIARDHKS
jgi:GntR family transcriptional regulator